MQVWSMVIMVAIYKNSSNADLIKYFLNASLVVYFIIFIIKYKFLYKVM